MRKYKWGKITLPEQPVEDTRQYQRCPRCGRLVSGSMQRHIEGYPNMPEVPRCQDYPDQPDAA